MVDPRIQIIALLMRIVLHPGMVIGIIGNSLNIIVLKRPTLYNYPCSRYFFALGCNNLFFSTFLFTFNLLAYGYEQDATRYCQFCCKIILYFQQLSIALSPYFIILGAFDRYCSSSSSVQQRNLSNLNFAKWSIGSVCVFFTLFCSGSLVMLESQSNQIVPCRISTVTIAGRIYPVIQAVLLSLVPPFFMLIFGLLTIYNTKKLQVIPAASSRHRRTEHQLARMLFVQVTCHILLSVPLCIIYVLGFMPVQYLSPLDYFFAFRITQLIYFSSFTISVILYFLSGRIYRTELMNIIRKLFCIKRNNRVAATGFTGQTIPMQTVGIISEHRN